MYIMCKTIDDCTTFITSQLKLSYIYRQEERIVDVSCVHAYQAAPDPAVQFLNPWHPRSHANAPQSCIHLTSCRGSESHSSPQPQLCIPQSSWLHSTHLQHLVAHPLCLYTYNPASTSIIPISTQPRSKTPLPKPWPTQPQQPTSAPPPSSPPRTTQSS
jgi:hypothetical protein